MYLFNIQCWYTLTHISKKCTMSSFSLLPNFIWFVKLSCFVYNVPRSMGFKWSYWAFVASVRTEISLGLGTSLPLVLTNINGLFTYLFSSLNWVFHKRKDFSYLLLIAQLFISQFSKSKVFYLYNEKMLNFEISCVLLLHAYL